MYTAGAATFCYDFAIIFRTRKADREGALSLDSYVVKAVKAASAIRSNRNRESYGTLCRTAVLRISSLPPISHGGNAAGPAFFCRLP